MHNTPARALLRRHPAAALSALLLCSLTSGPAAAAGTLGLPLPKVPERVWEHEKLGAHRQSWHVTQDPRGLTYVANNRGVLTYDGVRWNLIPSPTGGLVRALVLEPSEERKRLFVAVGNDFGVLEAEFATWHYKSLLEDLTPGERQKVGEVRWVRSDGARVVAQTLDRLFIWRPERQLVSLRPFQDQRFVILFEVDGRMFVSIGGGAVGELTSDDQVKPLPGVSQIPDSDSDWRDLRRGSVFGIEAADDGLLLMAPGAFFVHDDEGFSKAQQFPVPEGIGNLYCLERLSDGTYLAGSLEGILLHYSERGALIGLRDLETPVTSIVATKTDEVWVTQAGNTRQLALPGSLSFLPQDTLGSFPQVLHEHEGTIFVGLERGLSRLVATTNPDGVQAESVVGIEPQQIWSLASLGHHLIIGGQRATYALTEATSAEPQVKRLLGHPPVRVLQPSRAQPDALWVGREGEGQGLGRLTLDEAGMPGYRALGSITFNAHTIAEESPNVLWLGSQFQGLLRVTLANDEVQRADPVSIDRLLPEDSPHRYAFTFELDDQVLIGTQHGARQVRPGTTELELAHRLPDHFRDEALFRLAVDASGSLWARSTQETGTVDSAGDFDPRPFLLLPESSVRAVLPTSDGAIWLAGSVGLARLAPPGTDVEAPRAAVLIRSLARLDGEPVLRSQAARNRLDVAAPLQPSPETLRFEVGLVGFDAPQRAQFRYRLEPLQRGWSQWTTEGFRDFGNLGGGSYRFEAQARDHLGTETEIAVLQLRVQRRWHEQPALRLLALALGGALLFWLGRARLEQRNRELQARVDARTNELATARDLAVEQAREIERTASARSRFFANISHELRTPLTLAIGPLEDVLDGHHGEVRSDARQQIGVAQRASRRLLELVDQLLDLARSESSSPKLSRRRVDLARLCRGIVGMFESRAQHRGIRLVTRLPEEPALADVDVDAIEKLTTNLLGNALKFTPAGGVIERGVPRARAPWTLAVCDSGPGVPAADRERIFQPFTQLDHARGRAGAGLGLALARELAELHGGSLIYKQGHESGARFVASLPAAQAGRQEGTSPPTSSAPEARHEWQAPPLDCASLDDLDLVEVPADRDDVPVVLVVEDNPELRKYIVKHLQEFFRIVEATDGQTAWDLLEERGETLPDLVVSDLMMPRLDGLELCDRVRADQEIASLPFLLLTARDEVTESLDRGVDDHLVKPFDPQELRARVKALLRSRRLVAESYRSSVRSRTLIPAAPDVRSEDEAFLERVRDILEAHSSMSDFGVPQLASALGMSRAALYRRLDGLVDDTPAGILRSFRLERAAQLLAAHAGPVSEIAFSCGFASVSHFSKCFREKFGHSPSQHREE